MSLHRCCLRSLKARVTLGALAILSLSMGLLAFYASRTLRDDMQHLLGEKQSATATLLAAHLNEELSDRLHMLEAVAGNVDPAMLGNPAATSAFLANRLVLGELFGQGIFVLGANGKPPVAQTSQRDALDSDSIAAVLGDSRARIGRPFADSRQQTPVYGMIVPIRDARGGAIGALVGAVDLCHANFLERVGHAAPAQGGGFTLVVPQHRLIVSVADGRCQLETLPPPGSNAMIDQLVRGHEGYAVGIDPRGEEVLIASRSVPVAGWLLTVTLPTARAFAPIRAMQVRLLEAAVILTLLVGTFIWWVLKRQLVPLVAATRTLALQKSAHRFPQLLPSDGSQDEIDQLIGGFNSLLESLGRREEDLAVLAANLEQQVEERTRQLRAVSVQLTMTEERERRQLAEELHDNLGQLLAAIKIKLSVINGNFRPELMRDILELVGKADDVVRTIAQRWNPPVLKVLDFKPALESLGEEVRRLYGVTVRHDIEICSRSLGDETRSLLFRSVRELLINVARHARTDVADLTIRCDGTRLRIVVHDAGCGFDRARQATAASGSPRLGLNSIEERIQALGGTMTIDSTVGGGTTVTLTVPCAVLGPECPTA